MTSLFEQTAEGLQRTQSESSIRSLDLSRQGDNQRSQATNSQRDSQERQSTEHDSLLHRDNTRPGDQPWAEATRYITEILAGARATLSEYYTSLRRYSAPLSECSSCLRGGEDTSHDTDSARPSTSSGQRTDAVDIVEPSRAGERTSDEGAIDSARPNTSPERRRDTSPSGGDLTNGSRRHGSPEHGKLEELEELSRREPESSTGRESSRWKGKAPVRGMETATTMDKSRVFEQSRLKDTGSDGSSHKEVALVSATDCMHAITRINDDTKEINVENLKKDLDALKRYAIEHASEIKNPEEFKLRQGRISAALRLYENTRITSSDASDQFKIAIREYTQHFLEQLPIRARYGCEKFELIYEAGDKDVKRILLSSIGLQVVLTEAKPQVTGVEYSESLVKLIKEHAGEDFVVIKRGKGKYLSLDIIGKREAEKILNKHPDDFPNYTPESSIDSYLLNYDENLGHTIKERRLRGSLLLGYPRDDIEEFSAYHFERADFKELKKQAQKFSAEGKITSEESSLLAAHNEHITKLQLWYHYDNMKEFYQQNTKFEEFLNEHEDELSGIIDKCIPGGMSEDKKRYVIRVRVVGARGFGHLSANPNSAENTALIQKVDTTFEQSGINDYLNQLQRE